MSSQAVHSLFRADYRPPEPLSPDLNRWWQEKPDLFEPMAFAQSMQSTPSLRPDLQLNPETAPIDSDRFLKFCASLRAMWDRGSLAFMSKLSCPSILLGVVLTLLGFAGLLTAVTGIKFHMLAFISAHIPESIVISLTMIRAGIHSIASGVRRSRRQQRYRLEIQKNNHLLRIRQFVENVDDKDDCIREIKRLNQRVPPEMRMEHLLAAGYPYSKAIDDIPTSSRESYIYRLAVQQAINRAEFVGKGDLLRALPQLEEPLAASKSSTPSEIDEVDTARPLEDRSTSKFWEKWNNWWHERIPALGVLDVVVGQLMLICAIGSILFMFLNTSQVPAIFHILANDPGLSLTFSFILLANWVHCTRTGWRMLSWNQREAQRNAMAADLQLIDLGLERKSVEAFHEWINRRLDEVEGNSPEHVHRIRETIREHRELYLESLPDLEEKVTEAHRLRAAGYRESENCLIYGIHKAGKKIVHKMATPSIIVGCIIGILGAACLVMSVTNHIPPQLAMLAKNTPLSVLFSTGLLVAGIYASYRGIAMSDQNKKERWKKSSHFYRKQFLSELYPELEHPNLPRSQRAARTLLNTQELDLETIPRGREEEREAVASCCRNLSDKWFKVWRKTLNVLWLPDMVLGSFLLFSSLAGLAICLGAPAPASLQFISADPRFSLLFCVGLGSVALDALNASWRIGTYGRRKKRNHANLDKLRECYRHFSNAHHPSGVRV